MLCGRNNWNETISTILTKEYDGDDDGDIPTNFRKAIYGISLS